MPIALLPREALIKTGDVDHAAWNYDGLLGFVSRRRFELVRSLLPKRRVPKLLEVGYGSGVFFPELSKHAEQVYGADIHERPADVSAVLAKAGITVNLVTAPAEALPFADGTFDVVVAVSGRERWYDLAVEPMRGPDGALVGVTCVAAEVTDRVRAEAARAIASAALSIASAMGTRVSAVSVGARA